MDSAGIGELVACYKRAREKGGTVQAPEAVRARSRTCCSSPSSRRSSRPSRTRADAARVVLITRSGPAALPSGVGSTRRACRASSGVSRSGSGGAARPAPRRPRDPRAPRRPAAARPRANSGWLRRRPRRAACAARPPRQPVPPELVPLQVGEDLLRARDDHRLRHPREPRDVDAVGAVRGAGLDAVQEDHPVAPLAHRHPQVDDAGQRDRELRQLVVVGREERARRAALAVRAGARRPPTRSPARRRSRCRGRSRRGGRGSAVRRGGGCWRSRSSRP